MDGLVILTGLSLTILDLCGIVYLAKAGIKAIFTLIDIKKLLDEIE